MLRDPQRLLCECKALFYFIIQYILSEAQETFGFHFGTCHRRNYYQEFQRTIKSPRDSRGIKKKKGGGVGERIGKDTTTLKPKLSIQTEKIFVFFTSAKSPRISLLKFLHENYLRDP